MHTLKILPALVIALISQPALADFESTSNGQPFNAMQAQLDALAARVDTLESKAPNASVEGRTYCMLVNVTLLRSVVDIGPNAAPGKVETRVIKRVATFVDGAFTATLVSSHQNTQTDNDLVDYTDATSSPVVLLGNYSQAGNQVDLVFDTLDPHVAWYVSKDGSLIHYNGIDFFGPFGNGLTLGLVRSGTLVESDTCDPEPTATG